MSKEPRIRIEVVGDEHGEGWEMDATVHNSALYTYAAELLVNDEVVPGAPRNHAFVEMERPGGAREGYLHGVRFFPDTQPYAVLAEFLWEHKGEMHLNIQYIDNLDEAAYQEHSVNMLSMGLQDLNEFNPEDWQ